MYPSNKKYKKSDEDHCYFPASMIHLFLSILIGRAAENTLPRPSAEVVQERQAVDIIHFMPEYVIHMSH